MEHYNNVRLNGAIGYIRPKDMLAGHQREIQAERDRKLERLGKSGRVAASAPREFPCWPLSSAEGVPIPRVSCFRDFKNLAHGVWGKAFFRKLALALQGQF